MKCQRYIPIEASDEQQTWSEAVSINGRDVEFKLDTGSKINLLPLYIFKGLDQHHNLNKTKVILKAYDEGFRLKPLGQVKLNCSVKWKMINTEFLIVDKRVSPILRLKSVNSFGLVKRANISEIKSVSNKYVERDKFINEHAIIFEGIGTFPKKYKIKVFDNAVCIINPSRRVPQTILKRLKVELVKL